MREDSEAFELGDSTSLIFLPPDNSQNKTQCLPCGIRIHGDMGVEAISRCACLLCGQLFRFRKGKVHFARTEMAL